MERDTFFFLFFYSTQSAGRFHLKQLNWQSIIRRCCYVDVNLICAMFICGFYVNMGLFYLNNNISFNAGSNAHRKAVWQLLQDGIFYLEQNILCSLERVQGRWSAFRGSHIILQWTRRFLCGVGKAKVQRQMLKWQYCHLEAWGGKPHSASISQY